MKGTFLFKEVAFILAISTALLYVFGITFCQGYLLEFGVDDSLFPLSFHQALFQGFVSLSTLSVKAASGLFVAFMVMIIAITLFIFVREWWRKKRRVAKAKNEDLPNKDQENEPLLVLAGTALITIGGVLLVFIAIIMLIIASTKAGEEAAKRFRKQAEENQLKEVCVEMKMRENSFAGYSIMCNSSQCAYLAGKVSRIINLADMKSQQVTLK